MTDLTPKNSGYGKVATAGLALEIVQHVSPLAVSYLSQHYKIDETLGSELVYLGWSLVGAAFVKITPSKIVESVTDAILFCKAAVKSWRAAINS